MWLIDTETLSLKSFLANPPPYAILSHTWLPDDSEVTFADFQNENKTIRNAKAGFQKIKLTCEQAKREGIPYAWVDTCCINKDSSAELSEAINSMFKWYAAATTCYAYLDDFPDDSDEGNNVVSLSALQGCKWFSRGWTLQELVAPKDVVFFTPCGKGWVDIGTKESLCESLEQITRIPREILLHQKALDDFSVAARMSWAAGRQTTREEDTAYCLLGLFDVNMPLLYGEGMKAFIRLQEEIVRGERDDSLFAWCSTEAAAIEFPFRGLFASSPEEFAGSSDIKKMHLTEAGTDGTTSITGNGRVSLSCGVDPIDDDNGAILSLNCYRGDPSNTQAILSSRTGFNTYLRSNPSKLIHFDTYLRFKHSESVGPTTSSGSKRTILDDFTYLEYKRWGLLNNPPGALALRNITIEKYVLGKTAVTAENKVFRNDDILLGNLPDKFRIENVHFWLWDGVHETFTTMHTGKASNTQTVPVSKVINHSIAFEINIKSLCVEIGGQQTVVSGKFLLIFWIDAIPGSQLCTFHLDARIISSGREAAAWMCMNDLKPSRFNRRCKLVFGDLVVCITNCRRMIGSSRTVCPRLTISAKELSHDQRISRHHRNQLTTLVLPLAGIILLTVLGSFYLYITSDQLAADMAICMVCAFNALDAAINAKKRGLLRRRADLWVK